ncbi:RNase H family protein [Actinoallomurus iriomotensis]|uniref:RNase H type-1 domain-containing protein n=1 Tax=Actinoallomurus iriomotensis TaxID=478107 RepID=A0A9W6S5B3_9ACTN|nr:RNase H family protein [Actinoallomurus iriomotensis]GLY86007.1 hypothetical protein Airi02_039360 [Actinoallomurus iriomotensis]
MSAVVAATTAAPDITLGVLADRLGIPPKRVGRILRTARRNGLILPGSEDPHRELRAAVVAIFTRAPATSKQAIADELGIGKRRVYGLLRTAERLGEIPAGIRVRYDQRSDCGRPLAFVWTDGSAPESGNRGPAAWAAIIRWGAHPGAQVRTLTGRLPKPNAARAELAAAVHALRVFDQPACVTVHCDNRAIVDCADSRATPRAHLDLWDRLRDAAADHHVTWKWVRAHRSSQGNRRADSIARAVRKGPRLGEHWREDLQIGEVTRGVNHLVQTGRLTPLVWELSTAGPLHGLTHVATARTIDTETSEHLSGTGTGTSKAAAKTDALTHLAATLHPE